MKQDGFEEVDCKTFAEFCNENELTFVSGGYFGCAYINANKEEMAYRQAGLARDHYYIKTENNYEALDFITNKINLTSP